VNGIATFTNLSYNLAETITLNFTASGLSGVTSSNIVVSVGAFTKLQILAPGETAAPGTGTGKSGSPVVQSSGSPVTVTVNAVDANWNLVTNVTHTVGITSSDSNATVPTNAALAAGSKTFSVTLKTSGSATVTATDISDGTKTANTS